MSPPLKPFTDAELTVLPSQVQFGKELGRGNFSKVFLGVYKNQPVAIKQQELVDQDLERYLMNELAILRRVDHPGCIKFYGAYKQGGTIMNIITEYVEGGDLRRLLGDKAVPLGWRFRTRIASGCAKAISHLHKIEIVHRDIKTDNVLLTADASPKLCDFGFARQWDKTRTMTMCGTDEFMAPEIMFSMQYDEKVDVYSFGILLAEIMTRKVPGKLEGFLDRKPGDGFNVNHEELDRETNLVGAPSSLVLLTKECVASEASNRLDAPGVVDWLEDLLKELPEDKEPTPNLQADAIKDKLEQYILKQGPEPAGEGKDDDDDDDDESPRNAAAQARIAAALEQHRMRQQMEAAAIPTKTKKQMEAAAMPTKLKKDQSVKGGPGTKQVTLDAPEPAPRTQTPTNVREDAVRVPVEAPEAPLPRSASSGSSGLFSMCFGGGARRKSAAGHGLPEMQGWVTKRGGRIKTWKRRYMVITSAGIVYFKGPEDADGSGEAQGQIEWAEMSSVAGVVCNAVPSVMTGKANSFAVHTEGRTYFMVADNIDERGRWLRAISDGHRAWLDKQSKQNRKIDTRVSRNVGGAHG